MLYIYRRRNSTGARDLADGIMLGVEGGTRGMQARRTKGLALRTLTPQDQVICWGDHFAAQAGIRTLNNTTPLSKFNEAQKLTAERVPTVQVSLRRPAAVRAERPAFTPNRIAVPAVPNGFDEAAATALIERLTAFRRAEAERRAAHAAMPVPLAETWLPRKNDHVGGNDLLTEGLDPDFFSKKETLVEEYRIHMFKGKSIRAGKKVARLTRPDGHTAAHPWIRSFDAGWIIQYDNFESTKPMRKLASAALKALGLDFGAIDIGKKADGTLIVLECNRAPGVEGGTVEAYAKHIINWVRNPTAYDREEE